jgi:hypothetical protein
VFLFVDNTWKLFFHGYSIIFDVVKKMGNGEKGLRKVTMNL